MDIESRYFLLQTLLPSLSLSLTKKRRPFSSKREGHRVLCRGFLNIFPLFPPNKYFFRVCPRPVPSCRNEKTVPFPRQSRTRFSPIPSQCVFPDNKEKILLRPALALSQAQQVLPRLPGPLVPPLRHSHHDVPPPKISDIVFSPLCDAGLV